jgi:N-terminal domain of reverse transcriptase
MTVGQPTDASSTSPPLTWKTIDWSRVRQGVRRLQMRIAKATQARQHRKAQALQWVLTHSRSAKLLAVHRVTTNRGAKTPGVDKSKSEGPQTPMTQATPNTSRSADALHGACSAEVRTPQGSRPPPSKPKLFRTSLGCRRVPAQGAPVGAA